MSGGCQIYYLAFIVKGVEFDPLLKVGECKAAGLPKPVFEIIPNFVCLTIRFKHPLTPHFDREENGGIKALNENLKQIYLLIYSTPGIKTNQVAEKLTRPLPTVEKQMAILKKMGLIEHRGSRKNGGYYVK